MIIRMSKVEIAGLKELLGDFLEFLREEGLFQIETETVGFIEMAEEEYINKFTIDQKTLTEKLLLEDLKFKISELFSYLPQISLRKSYIEPENIIDTVRRLVVSHIQYCENIKNKKESLQMEFSELNRYKIFLDAIEPMIGTIQSAEEIDFIGLTIKDAEAILHIRKLLFKITDGKYELFTNTAPDGSIAGIIVVEKDFSENIRKTLSDERIPEVSFPSVFERLAFNERVRIIKERMTNISEEIKTIDEQIARFAIRWRPLYEKTLEWIDDRLSIMKASAHVFETRDCFIIYGWVPSENVPELSRKIEVRFRGNVTLLEREIMEEDIERIPVVLRNPPYFQPFEIMVRLLPLPRYSSFDPTPFIGIFFPILFGMILGDAGYGLMLLGLAIFLAGRFREKKTVLV